MSGQHAPLPVEDWLGWLLAQVRPLAPRTVPVQDAAGMVLLEPAPAAVDLPPWDSSAMDGYAVRSADAHDGAELSVHGEVRAGSAEDPDLPPGGAIRIMTGAPVPSAADAVIPVEHTLTDVRSRLEGEALAGAWVRTRIGVHRAADRGSNVRRRGEDIRRGEVLVPAGERLGPLALAGLAAAGVREVRASPRPRVLVLSTGSELSRGEDHAESGGTLPRGRIPESNSVLLASLLRSEGIEPVLITSLPDDPDAVIGLIRHWAPLCDLILSTGGVGPGSHDIMRIALQEEPGVRAERVALKPGAPQCAGRLLGGALITALPGNPLAAAAGFELFVRPVLRALQGCAQVHSLRVTAIAAEGWTGSADRLEVLPVVLDQGEEGLRCRLAAPSRQVSHSSGRSARAQALVLVPHGRAEVRPGETVDLVLLGP